MTEPPKDYAEDDYWPKPVVARHDRYAVNWGRYQFILWRRWGWSPYRNVENAPLGYIYDRLGQFGPLEIRRFAPHPEHKRETA